MVVPNYRLCPQVTGAQAFEDCEDAYEYAVGALPAMVYHRQGVTLDPNKVVAMGHSIGGTMALHLAAQKPVKAVTAFYPSLFLSDISTSAHKPGLAQPFTMGPGFHPSEEEWASVQPETVQVSEAQLAVPGSPLDTRYAWLVQLLDTGRWASTVQPDGDFAAIDPLTRLHTGWPPVMIVQGELDDVPGSSLELARRAEREIKDAGNEQITVEVVTGQGHAFDLASEASQIGDPRWAAVVKGIDWLTQRRGALKTTSTRRVRVPDIDVHIRYV